MSITTYYQHISESGELWSCAILRSDSTSGKFIKHRVIALLYLVFVLSLHTFLPVALPHHRLWTSYGKRSFLPIFLSIREKRGHGMPYKVDEKNELNGVDWLQNRGQMIG